MDIWIFVKTVCGSDWDDGYEVWENAAGTLSKRVWFDGREEIYEL